MAKKIERNAPATSAPDAQKGATDELAILHPERECFIAGRRLVVREYGFVEGLQIRTIAKPFMEALYAATGTTGGRPPSFAQVEDLLTEHSSCVIELMARAADFDPEFVASLSDEDGYRLMQEWWLANAGFFIRRVMQRLATENAAAKLRAGRVSTTRSSALATDTRPATSEDSPPVS